MAYKCQHKANKPSGIMLVDEELEEGFNPIVTPKSLLFHSKKGDNIILSEDRKHVRRIAEQVTIININKHT